jgi:agmatine deiminase
MPAEWEPHRATWLAWPSHADLWLEDLAPARQEFAALCRGLVAPAGASCPAAPFQEKLEILVLDEAAGREAAGALAGLPTAFHRETFGDIWLRDTGPTFARSAEGDLLSVRFRFNGWGGKYDLEGDLEVAARIAGLAGAGMLEVDLTLEGGGIEVDGEGTCLTTRQCVLNANRNPGLTETRAETLLGEALGAERVLWLERGLANDHTDGHVDTLARFIAPGVVACMEARESSDPNRDVLAEILAALRRATDARGRRLEVVAVPSPGAVLGRDGRPMPASYLNFYISNTAVLVPTYRCAYDDDAVAILSQCFPGRTTIGSPARAILSGGGAFHCITQQEPLLRRP